MCVWLFDIKLDYAMKFVWWEGEDSILSPAEAGKCSVFPGYRHPAKTPPLQQKSTHHCKEKKMYVLLQWKQKHWCNFIQMVFLIVDKMGTKSMPLNNKDRVKSNK